MAFKVVVTEDANQDLAELVLYIAQDNQPAAERFGFALLDKIKILENHPFLGRIVPERDDPTLREIIHPPYRVVYRVYQDRQLIEVLRFWHGARGELKLRR